VTLLQPSRSRVALLQSHARPAAEAFCLHGPCVMDKAELRTLDV